jgi:hypothetical protein
MGKNVSVRLRKARFAPMRVLGAWGYENVDVRYQVEEMRAIASICWNQRYKIKKR